MKKEKGIKETFYDEFRSEGYSILESLEMAEERYEQFMAELSRGEK